MRNTKAFTLVELLIVVAVIGVLSGILLNVINVNSTRGKARDGVRIANMGKLIQALEAYCIAEESCPTNADVTGMSGKIPNYVREWPQAVPDASYSYNYSRINLEEFVLYVKADRENNSSCYKYTTSDSKLKFCPSARCGTNANMASCVEIAQ